MSGPPYLLRFVVNLRAGHDESLDNFGVALLCGDTKRRDPVLSQPAPVTTRTSIGDDDLTYRVRGVEVDVGLLDDELRPHVRRMKRRSLPPPHSPCQRTGGIPRLP